MSLIIEKNLYINTAPQKVWETLTQGELTKKYMAGLQVKSDFYPDSVIEFQKIVDGEEMVMLKGEILEIETLKLLKYTLFDPHKGIPDVPVNYTTVSYGLTPQKGGTLVELEQGDFTFMQEGQQAYEQALLFWEQVLKEMKKTAESMEE